jgi:hypothetical protein
LAKEVARLKAEAAASAKPLTTVMVMQDERSPRMTYVLNRGNYAQPRKDEPLLPGVPASLGELPADVRRPTASDSPVGSRARSIRSLRGSR